MRVPKSARGVLASTRQLSRANQVFITEAGTEDLESHSQVSARPSRSEVGDADPVNRGNRRARPNRTLLHRIESPRLTVTPFLDDLAHGIFATRSPARPNPIGLSTDRLVAISGSTIEIEDGRGADVLRVNGPATLRVVIETRLRSKIWMRGDFA